LERVVVERKQPTRLLELGYVFPLVARSTSTRLATVVRTVLLPKLAGYYFLVAICDIINYNNVGMTS